MSDAFVGEIRMFAGNFSPSGFALCDGQLLSINQNNALYALLGTIYGGDGSTTFALPDLRGRLPLHRGQGPGLTNRPIGSKGGTENVTLTSNQMPSHGHALTADASTGANSVPAATLRLATAPGLRKFQSTGPLNTTLDAASIVNSGGGQPHNNVMPFQSINFIIALFGVFPT